MDFWSKWNKRVTEHSTTEGLHAGAAAAEARSEVVGELLPYLPAEQAEEWQRTQQSDKTFADACRKELNRRNNS